MKNKDQKLNKILFILSIIVIIIVVLFITKKADAPILDNNDSVFIDTKILGNKEDLVSFSILPNTKVHGILSYRGVIKGGYFFEANILINILDMNKKVLKSSNAVAKSDWMTIEPVSFEGNIDFTGLSKGPAYFEIHNDNPSDIRANDKSILIPIIIN